jgi:Glycosyl hydrolases family 43
MLSTHQLLEEPVDPAIGHPGRPGSRGKVGKNFRRRRTTVVVGGMAVVAAVVLIVTAAMEVRTTPVHAASALTSPSSSSSQPAASPPLATDEAAASITTTRPPVNPNLAAPGQIVPSGENESDPFLYRTQDRYYLYTSGIPANPPINVPVASATDFGAWSPVVDALPVLPHWAAPGFTWAPDIHQFGSTYVLYFTAEDAGIGQQCVGVAISASPLGPFTAAQKPFICQTSMGGTIDPRVFSDSSGTTWMLFKSDQNIDGAATPTMMWSQRLAPDGLHLTGQATKLMGPDEPWQGTIIEAPDMVEVNGTYWVVYSGNWFNQPAYAIGAARCAGPSGPCADTTAHPLLGSNAQGAGPGEASVYTDNTGSWMLYSPVLASKDDVPRAVMITRIGFASSGPYLAAGGPPPTLDPFAGSSLWSSS